MGMQKILVVDDERALVDIVKMRLEANGYEVIVAFDGVDGFEKARTEKPDLIILDLMLPKMDGCKVCALLKRNERYQHIPIIIFTAKAQEIDQRRAHDVGADDYLMKPFHAEVLLEKIKNLLKLKCSGSD